MSKRHSIREMFLFASQRHSIVFQRLHSPGASQRLEPRLHLSRESFRGQAEQGGIQSGTSIYSSSESSSDEESSDSDDEDELLLDEVSAVPCLALGLGPDALAPPASPDELLESESESESESDSDEELLSSTSAVRAFLFRLTFCGALSFSFIRLSPSASTSPASVCLEVPVEADEEDVVAVAPSSLPESSSMTISARMRLTTRLCISMSAVLNT